MGPRGVAVFGTVGVLLVVNVCGALSVTLQLSALYALSRQPFARLWHLSIVLATVIVSVSLAHHPAPRLVIVCSMIAAVLVLVALRARRIGRAVPGRGALLLALGSVAAAFVFAARSAGARSCRRACSTCCTRR